MISHLTDHETVINQVATHTLFSLAATRNNQILLVLLVIPKGHSLKFQPSLVRAKRSLQWRVTIKRLNEYISRTMHSPLGVLK